MYNRKHFPGCVRPARPARWWADACWTRALLLQSTDNSLQDGRKTVSFYGSEELKSWANAQRGPRNSVECREGIHWWGARCILLVYAQWAFHYLKISVETNGSTLEIGDTRRDSTLILGLYTFCLANPGSITNTIPSIVNDVSAMLVETTIFLPGGPPGSPIGACQRHNAFQSCDIEIRTCIHSSTNSKLKWHALT